MLYSSGALGVFASAKTILGSESSSVLASKKIETSDPKEIDEAFIRAELGVDGGESVPGSGVGTLSLRDDEKRPFAKPKGPGRRR
jgi:twinfilin